MATVTIKMHHAVSSVVGREASVAPNEMKMASVAIARERVPWELLGFLSTYATSAVRISGSSQLRV